MSAQPSQPAFAPPVALVTGGRTGIGAATALALARAGFGVAIVDRVDDDQSRATLSALEATGVPSCFVRGDIADLDEHERIIDAVTRRLGELSCVVNNAGVQMSPRADLLQVDPEMFDAIFRVNVRGTFFFAQRCAHRLVSSPSRVKSLIVVTSVNAALASVEKSAYCMSKAALSMMARLFSVRLARHDVDVYEIRPGLIRTEMTRPVHDQYSAAIADGLSLTRRWGEPEEVANAVRALAAGELTFMTGEILNVGGGIQVARL